MKKILALDTYDLYLRSKPYEVIQTNMITDCIGGVYPCYYTVQDNRLLVSNSAYAIIRHLGNFKKHVNKSVAISWTPTSYDTYDLRVHRVHPFQKLYLDTSGKLHVSTMTTIIPSLSISSLDEFIPKSAKMLSEHCWSIEEQYPDVKHIVEVGGKDSQLILLVPKRNPDNWYVFSGKPNAPLVEEFIKMNDIQIAGFFSDAGSTPEEADNEWNDHAFIREKVISTDALINLATLQWGKTHREQLKAHFSKQQVLFWDGTAGGGLNSQHNIKPLIEKMRSAWSKGISAPLTEKFDIEQVKPLIADEFIKDLTRRISLYQGSYHQMNKNLLGTTTLDFYGSPKLWAELYCAYDPTMFADFDCRMLLGDEIFGKEVKWISQNPAPGPWRRQQKIDIKKIYFDAIREGK